MSFILDALKKSESDRQRQSGPSLFEVKVAPPRRRLPIWAMAIAVLLVINVVVVSWMMLRRPAAQPPAAANTPAPTPAAPAAAAPAPASAPAARAASVAGAPAATPTAPVASAGTSAAAAPEGAVPQAGASEAAKTVAAPAANSRGTAGSAPAAGGTDQGSGQSAESGNPSDYAPAVEPAAAQAPGTPGGSAGDLPLYQQIVTSDGLPTLHLDLHVYADRPQDRFAMINMHRVGEGDSLPNGAQVEAIRPDGVVLSYRGTRFLLPRN